MKDNTLLVSASLVYRKKAKLMEWFLIKQTEDQGWELPKTIARTGESSVRAGIRAMAEQGGMRAKVLEEVGRSGGAAKVNGRAVTQRTIYYLMEYKDGGEVLGYSDYQWVEHSKALRTVGTKRDQQMIKDAKKLLKEIRANRKKLK